jgi:hypothetical protein
MIIDLFSILNAVFPAITFYWGKLFNFKNNNWLSNSNYQKKNMMHTSDLPLYRIGFHFILLDLDDINWSKANVDDTSNYKMGFRRWNLQ